MNRSLAIINFYSLELPLMVAYSPGKAMSIELGPTAGVFLGAKIVTDAGSDKISEIYKELELGITRAGVGVLHQHRDGTHSGY